MDSVANNHITNNLTNLNIRIEYKGNGQLNVGNKIKLLIVHIRHETLPIMYIQTTKYILVKHVLYVPIITKNLLSQLKTKILTYSSKDISI